MSKFRITKADGSQSEIESDMTIDQIAAMHSPTTDIQPIQEQEAEDIVVETKKTARKAKAE